MRWELKSSFYGVTASLNAEKYIQGVAVEHGFDMFPTSRTGRKRQGDGAYIVEHKCPNSHSHKCRYKIRYVNWGTAFKTDVETLGDHDHTEDFSKAISKAAKKVMDELIVMRMYPAAIRGALIESKEVTTVPELSQVQTYRSRNFHRLLGSRQVNTLDQLVAYAKEHNLLRLPQPGGGGDSENEIGVLMWMVPKGETRGKFLNRHNEFEELEWMEEGEYSWIGAVMECCEQDLPALPHSVRCPMFEYGNEVCWPMTYCSNLFCLSAMMTLSVGHAISEVMFAACVGKCVAGA